MEIPNVQNFVQDNPVISFYHKSVRVLSVCSRPRRKEFEKMARVTTIGIVIMGVLGVIISFIFGLI